MTLTQSAHAMIRTAVSTFSLPLILCALGCMEVADQSNEVESELPTSLLAPAELDISALTPSTVAPEPLTGAPSIMIYKDYNAWWAENRDEHTLSAPPFNLVRNVDYEVRPTFMLSTGIPEHVRTVIITSNSYGNPITALNVNQPYAQMALDMFVKAGGQLVVHLGDNSLPDYGFLVPGMRTRRVQDAYDYPMRINAPSSRFARGPDGIAGNSDDATAASIAVPQVTCCAFHGSLTGALPDNARVHVTDSYGRPLYAEYSYGAGRVIVGTITFEFGIDGIYGQRTRLLINHFWNVLNPPPDNDRDGISADEDCDDQNGSVGHVIYETSFEQNDEFLSTPPQLSEQPWLYEGGAVIATSGSQQALIGQARDWSNVAIFATLSSRGTWGGCCEQGPTNRWRAGIVLRAALDDDQDEGFHGYRCALASNAETVDGVPHSGDSTGHFLQVAKFLDDEEDEVGAECEGGVNSTFTELGRADQTIADPASGETATLAFYAFGQTLQCEVTDGSRKVTVRTADADFAAGTVGVSTLNMLGEFKHIKVCEALGVPGPQ